MSVGALAGAVVGVVLVASGALKLAHPGWPAQAADLGVPRWLARLVPAVELGLGAVLAVGLALPASAWAAAGLLVAFTALLARTLAQGRRPVCACFGRWSRRPIGPWSLVRNAVLLVLAVTAAVA